MGWKGEILSFVPDLREISVRYPVWHHEGLAARTVCLDIHLLYSWMSEKKLNDVLLETGESECLHNTGLGFVFCLIIDQPLLKGYGMFTAAFFCLIWHIGNGQLQKWKALFFLEGEAMEISWDCCQMGRGQKLDYILKGIYLLICSSVHLFFAAPALRNEGSGASEFIWFLSLLMKCAPLRIGAIKGCFMRNRSELREKANAWWGLRFPGPRSGFMRRSFSLVARWFSLVKTPGHFPPPIYC